VYTGSRVNPRYSRNRCFVIGEGQDRVTAWAYAHGCDWMPDLPGYWSKSLKMSYNAVWMVEQMGLRRTLYDYGPRYWTGYSSPYYKLEKGLSVVYWPQYLVRCPWY